MIAVVGYPGTIQAVAMPTPDTGAGTAASWRLNVARLNRPPGCHVVTANDAEASEAATITGAQARSLIGSTVEIWSNDEASASEGVAPDWLGTVADVVSIGDKWHFVIQED